MFSKPDFPMPIDPAHPDVKPQYAALCYRVVKGKPQVLLITSRGTKRWIVPKGWPMDHCGAGDCAAQEAWEEAGVTGTVAERPMGIYTYPKMLGSGEWVPCAALLFPLRVKALKPHYPERKERRRKWFSPRKAAKKVDEPELADLIRGFDPRHVKL